MTRRALKKNIIFVNGIRGKANGLARKPKRHTKPQHTGNRQTPRRFKGANGQNGTVCLTFKNVEL